MSKWILEIGTASNDAANGIFGMAYEGTPAADAAFTLQQACMNPSYIILSPDQKHVYAVLETDQWFYKAGSNERPCQGGRAACYDLAADGTITPAGEQLTLGRGPCYITTDAGMKALYTANYNDGTVSCFPLDEEGHIKPLGSLVLHQGMIPGAHAHCTRFAPDGKRLWVCDLGQDALLCYEYDPATAALKLDADKCLYLEKGKGPRHILFHPSNNFAYVVDELGSRVNALAWCPECGKLTLKQTLSLLPEGFEGHNGAAAIRMSADGRFLYLTNRGHNSVVVYAIGEDGLLTFVQRASCGGDFPRDIDLDPTGKFMFVANQRSNTVDVLAVCPETGMLSETGISYSVPGPTCILFVPAEA